MALTKIGLVSALCASMTLTGCSVIRVTEQIATTPGECQTQWLQERRVRDSGIYQSTGFEEFMRTLAIAFSGATTSAAAADARYRACLMRNGVNDTESYMANNHVGVANVPYVTPLPPRRDPRCPPGASVLYGGSGYCIGR